MRSRPVAGKSKRRPIVLLRNDAQPEFLRSFADTIIEAEEHQSRDCCPGSEHGRKMDRIERSDRFAGKRLAGALYDLRPDVQDLPAGCGRR
jgi:hypothetical protein